MLNFQFCQCGFVCLTACILVQSFKLSLACTLVKVFRIIPELRTTEVGFSDCFSVCLNTVDHLNLNLQKYQYFWDRNSSFYNKDIDQ